MGNTLNIGSQVSFVAGQLKVVFPLVDSLTTTGSNFVANNANIVTGSWQVLDQASNTNFRYGFFANTDQTSSVKLAISAAGTSSYAAFLMPGDVCILPNSGSAVIYAEAVGANSPIILQYFLTEA